MGILVQNWVEKPSIWGGKRGDSGGRGAVFGWKKAFFGVEKGVFWGGPLDGGTDGIFLG